MSAALDGNFLEVAELAEQHIARGDTVFQKFTCGGCGVRQTMETPNVFYTSGKCEECGHTTNLVTAGCSFLLVVGGGGSE